MPGVQLVSTGSWGLQTLHCVVFEENLSTCPLALQDTQYVEVDGKTPVRELVSCSCCISFVFADVLSLFGRANAVCTLFEVKRCLYRLQSGLSQIFVGLMLHGTLRQRPLPGEARLDEMDMKSDLVINRGLKSDSWISIIRVRLRMLGSMSIPVIPRDSGLGRFRTPNQAHPYATRLKLQASVQGHESFRMRLCSHWQALVDW
jgi:hypothetical protein